MIDKLRSIVVANGMMMIHVEREEIIITAYQNEIRIPLEKVETPPEWNGGEVQSKGECQWLITSDIFDVFEEELSLDALNEEEVKDVLTDLLSKSLQYIAKIIIEEGVAVLMVNSFNRDTRYLLSTIGLLEDIRIIFAEIKQKER